MARKQHPRLGEKFDRFFFSRTKRGGGASIRVGASIRDYTVCVCLLKKKIAKSQQPELVAKENEGVKQPRQPDESSTPVLKKKKASASGDGQHSSGNLKTPAKKAVKPPTDSGQSSRSTAKKTDCGSGGGHSSGQHSAGKKVCL